MAKRENIIPISNFLRMMPQIPQASSKNQNYLISGADPLSYLANNLQEEQIAPLSASGYFASTGYNYTGDVCQIIDGGGTGQDVVIATKTGRVYGASLNGTVKKWYADATVDGGATTDGSQRIALFAKNIVWSSSGGHLYWTAYVGTVWAQIATSLASSTVKYLEPFLEYLYFNDDNAGGTGQVIKKLWSDMTTITSYTFPGAGWSILRMTNYNDKYLAFVASKNLGSINNSYLFLWDGIADRPNYSVKINGQFQDMYVSQGTLYVLTQERGGQSALYYLTGTTLRRMQSIQIDNISLQVWGSGLVYGSNMFNYGGLLGIRLNNKGLLLLGQLDSGEAEYIIAGPTYSAPTSYLNNPKSAGIGSVATIYAASANTVSYYVPYSGGGVTDSKISNITYQSQWIPVRNLQGIDIWYENPPSVTGDSINVTIYGQGENVIAGNQTINLKSITSTNYLNKKRSRLDIADSSTGEAFAGDQVMIKITTTIGAGSTWYPIIRQLNLITS